MDMMRLGLFVAFLAIVSIFTAGYFALPVFQSSLIEKGNSGGPLSFYLPVHSGLNGYVTVQLTRNGITTTYPTVIAQAHNFFSTAGKESIFNILGTSQAGIDNDFDVIELGNDTNGVGFIQGPYVDSGLSNATGAVIEIVPGNWSIVASFTSTANSKDVNATGLFNGTSGGANAGAAYFAGNNFTKVTLQNGDVLTVTWNVSVN